MTDLDDLDRLAAAATPGPWRAYLDGYITEGEDAPMDRTDLGQYFTADIFGPRHRDDRDLIVALVNAAPSLIAELRAARRVVVAAREVARVVEGVDLRNVELLALRAALSEVPE